MKTNQQQKNIPTGWQQVKLGDCLVIKHGKPQKEIEVTDGKYPILATGGVIGRTNTPLYSKPSVLIGRKGTIDKPRYMDTPFWTVDTLFYSQIKENSIPKYLFYKFNTIEWYDYNEASGVPSLSATTVSSIKFNLPPLAEQTRIVSILETWDKSIEKLIEKVEVKKKIKKGLTDQYIYKRKDTTEYFIEDLFELGRGRVIAKGEIESNSGIYPVYSSQTSNNGIFGNIDTYDFEGEYLTWTTDGAHAGRVFYRTGRFNCTNVCGTAKLKTNLKVNLYFVYSYLNYITKNYVSYVGNPKLMNGVFGRIQIKLPDIKEQEKIAKILMVADKEIQELERKLSIIKEQRKYLLNNLITGTIRTPETLSTKLTK